MGDPNVKNIPCPFYNGAMISLIDCFSIAMVCEGMSPKNDVDPEITMTENYKEICLKCRNHY